MELHHQFLWLYLSLQALIERVLYSFFTKILKSNKDPQYNGTKILVNQSFLLLFTPYSMLLCYLQDTTKLMRNKN